MHLEVLLPFGLFLDEPHATRIVAETASGSMGLLPRRLDFIAALVPGILSYYTAEQGEVSVAVDEGVIVKAGDDVRVSVRRAFRGPQGSHDLSALREAIESAFLVQNAQDVSLRSAMAKVESGFVRRFAQFAKR